MALDRGVTQTLNIRANGDQLLAPLRAMGNQITQLAKQLETITNPSTKKGQQEVAALSAQMGKLLAQSRTLYDVLNNGSNSGRARNRLFAELDANAMGKKTASASRLARELQTTKTAADALEVRLAQLYKSFAKLGDAGRKVSQTDLNKAMRTDEAVRQVRRLEQELSKLEARQRVTGKPLSGDASKAYGDVTTARDALLKRIQNPNRVNWTTEIVQLEQLIARYRNLTKAEQDAAIASDRAASARRRSLLQQANQSEPQMLASINRAAGGFSFTQDQARGFNVRQLNQEIEQGKIKLTQYQYALSRAFAQGRSQALVDRLGGAFDRLKLKIAEATAQQKAFQSLPEQRIKSYTDSLMGSGGLSLLGRSVGLSFGMGAAFGMVNALQAGAREVVAFEDGLAKLQAIAGATDIQMKKLGASIIDVAKSSRYSIQEIVDATTTIAQAGYSASEADGILKDALILAAGSGSTPTEAVDTLTSALGAFQLQASESTRIVDTMMQSLNESKLTISQLQAAIQYAGATAKENGVNFEELAAITASLANAGIRSGSTIGTGLRQLMVDLKTPTEDFKKELKSLGLTLADVDVKSLGLAEVVRRLTDAGFSAEQAYSSFEVRAASSFLAFRNQIDNYDQLAMSIAQTGAAAKANAAAMESFSAQWQRFKNQVIAGLSEKLEGVLAGLGKILKIVNDLGEVSESKTLKSIEKLNDQLTLFAINPAAGAMSALAAIFGKGSEAASDLETRVNESEEALASQQQTVTTVEEAIDSLINRQATLSTNNLALQAETVTLTTRFQGLASNLDTTALSYDNLIQSMIKYRNEQVEQEGVAARSVRRTAEDQVKNIDTALRSQRTSFGQTQAQYSNPTATTAAKYLFDVLGSVTNRENVVQRQLRLQGYSEDLKDLRSSNPEIKALIAELDKAGNNMRELSRAYTRYDQADLTVQRANEEVSTQGTSRTDMQIQLQQGFGEDRAANRAKPGSGNASARTRIKGAKVYVGALNRDLELAKTRGDRAAAANLLEDIQSIEAQINQMERDFARQAEDEEKARKDAGLKPGDVEVQFRRPTGRHTSGFGRRASPGGRGSTNHRGHDFASAAGTPVLAAADGYVVFAGQGGGYGNLVKIAHGNGIESWYGHMLDGSINVKAGDSVSAGQQIGGVGSTGTSTGNHLHFEVRRQGSAVDPNASGWKFNVNPGEAGKDGDSAQAENERKLAQLLGEAAKNRTGETAAAIRTTITQAKSGTRGIGAMTSDFNGLLDEYRSRKAAEYDITHPTDGLSFAEIDAVNAGRTDAMAKVEEEIAGFFAEFWRQIADTSGKALDAALAASQSEYEKLAFGVEQGVAEVGSRGRTRENGLNRSRFGVGAAYRQQKEEFQARLDGDKELERGMAWRELGTAVAIGGYKADIASLDPNSEGYKDAVVKLAEAEATLLGIQRERAEVQRSINERTQEFTEIPFWEGLKNSVAAWAENSGAMDSWGKTLENSIGPALDTFTDQLAQMWTSIVQGTATVKQALTGFVAAFAKFVMQIIAKALALMAVKAILSAFGLQLNDGPGGVSIGKRGAYNGGYVSANDNGTRKAYSGGYVNRGVSNRDSANYDLAYGEYVVRNKSVRELGLPFMEAINKHGAKGLAKMGAAGTAFTSIQAPKQETNVYVVADRQQAGMGPNDVLVTIHEDIMQGGPTKKLIRQVAQGG